MMYGSYEVMDHILPCNTHNTSIIDIGIFLIQNKHTIWIVQLCSTERRHRIYDRYQTIIGDWMAQAIAANIITIWRELLERLSIIIDSNEMMAQICSYYALFICKYYVL